MLNVLFDYFFGMLFVVGFLIIIPAFGKRLTRNSYSYSFSLIIGYVVYTFLQFIGGFFTQLLELQWLFYCSYMMVLILGIAAFSYVRIDLKKCFIQIKEHIYHYWFMYFVACLLVVFSVMNTPGQMLANHLDDGYYLTRVALTPFIGQMDLSSIGVLDATLDLVRVFNTHEIEMGFYCNVLKIEPTLFCRVFVNLLHYCIYLHAIYAFIEKIQDSIRKNNKKVYSFLCLLYYYLELVMSFLI